MIVAQRWQKRTNNSLKDRHARACVRTDECKEAQKKDRSILNEFVRSFPRLPQSSSTNTPAPFLMLSYLLTTHLLLQCKLQLFWYIFFSSSPNQPQLILPPDPARPFHLAMISRPNPADLMSPSRTQSRVVAFANIDTHTHALGPSPLSCFP